MDLDLEFDLIWDAQRLGLLTDTVRPAQKGFCPYCQRQIGRGIHRHLKACKERKN